QRYTLGVLRFLAVVMAMLSLVPADAAPRRGMPKRSGGAARGVLDVLGEGYRLYVAGKYGEAAHTLAPIVKAPLAVHDYVLYLLGQAELMHGQPELARARFVELAQLKGRFATMARWRVADCDWEAGDLETARKEYEAALPTANDAVEPAVARWRIGEALAQS